jgi:hypothetical protein
LNGVGGPGGMGAGPGRPPPSNYQKNIIVGLYICFCFGFFTMTSHNLDIQNYTYPELLQLFDLKDNSYLTIEDIKRAKHKVLMIHPDKSNLPSEYFLFYKKAFDLVYEQFENTQKERKTVPHENPDYVPIHNELKSTDRQITAAINKISIKEFNQTFNKLFDKTVISKIDATKNDWFVSETSKYDLAGENVTHANLQQKFDQIKQNTGQIVRHRETMEIRSQTGYNLYDTAEDSDEYITSDPFSKFKYDDLRKVHKDETILPVSERDFAKVKQYASVDAFNRARNDQTLNPLERARAEELLETRRREHEQKIQRLEHASKLEAIQNAERSKGVLSHFLQIK